MRRLRAQQPGELQQLFGDRVSFALSQRRLYGHDVAALPSLLRPLTGSCVPDAVVQPACEEELVGLARWALRHGVALTPQGKATSGYGGVLPVQGGVAVDLRRMDRLLAVDAAAMTATVEAGAVCARLQEQLAAWGVAPQLYPTSYPASTVGGWLAQGGAGIGSFEKGWFRDHVAAARLVTADGSVRELSGHNVELAADAEGITGLISTVVLHVQRDDAIETVAIDSPDAHALQRLAERLVAERVPVWSLVFINPLMAELKNRAPLPTRRGQPLEERVLLPAAYITTLAFRSRDAKGVREALPGIVAACDGELLSHRIARHEREHRSRLMTVKRLGPSLVPAEVVVLLAELGAVMTEIERKADQPIVEEGLVIRDGCNGGPEAVILGLIPSDQRTFRYNLVFPLVLTILKVAEAYGGRPYATGLYFAKKADAILGTERVRRLRACKAEVDPRGLLNPGKVLGNGVLGLAMGVAGALEPLIRPFGNYVTTQVGERPTAPVRGVPAELAWYAYSCSQCGYCTEVCTQFLSSGWESPSPCGKWYWLRQLMAGREAWDADAVRSILACTTCEACDRVCSAVLPIEGAWMTLRGVLVAEGQHATLPLFEVLAGSLRREGNCWLGRRANRAAWLPDDLAASHGPGRPAETLYLTGCTACYVEQDACIGTARLLDAAGVPFAALGQRESCCGMPMLMAGKTHLFADTMRRNVEAVHQAGASEVVTSCPACDLMWRHVYRDWAQRLGLDYDVRARHYTEVIAERLAGGRFAFPPADRPAVRVAWHDPCHLGRASGVYDAPRAVIEALPGVEMVELAHHHDQALCCGEVVTLLHDARKARKLARDVLDEARATGAATLLSACPCCQLLFRLADVADLQVVDLSHLAAEALGYPLRDPTPEVRRLWASLASQYSVQRASNEASRP